jgi:hypothetical protein
MPVKNDGTTTRIHLERVTIDIDCVGGDVAEAHRAAVVQVL